MISFNRWIELMSYLTMCYMKICYLKMC